MDEIKKIFSRSENAGHFARGYVNYLIRLFEKLNFEEIDRLANEMENARIEGKNIFVIGNGGSASTATTMANDLGFDVIKKTGVENTFRMFSLTDNNALMMAIANDIGYENLFISQLMIHYREGDLLIAISASGNSQNIVKAAEWVKSKKGKVIGFLGFDGGKLKELSDIAIHIATGKGEYGPVEDIHLVVNHILAHWFQNKLNGHN